MRMQSSIQLSEASPIGFAMWQLCRSSSSVLQITFCSMKKGALNVATSLDLFGHISVLSSVEKARATVATRKPSSA